jgi:hypothetical protein
VLFGRKAAAAVVVFRVLSFDCSRRTRKCFYELLLLLLLPLLAGWLACLLLLVLVGGGL